MRRGSDRDIPAFGSCLPMWIPTTLRSLRRRLVRTMRVIWVRLRTLTSHRWITRTSTRVLRLLLLLQRPQSLCTPVALKIGLPGMATSPCLSTPIHFLPEITAACLLQTPRSLTAVPQSARDLSVPTHPPSRPSSTASTASSTPCISFRGWQRIASLPTIFQRGSPRPSSRGITQRNCCPLEKTRSMLHRHLPPPYPPLQAVPPTDLQLHDPAPTGDMRANLTRLSHPPRSPTHSPTHTPRIPRRRAASTRAPTRAAGAPRLSTTRAITGALRPCRAGRRHFSLRRPPRCTSYRPRHRRPRVSCRPGRMPRGCMIHTGCRGR
jgi:hypothetical protein